MEVIECKNNVKCDLGGCKNRATHAIKFDRALRNRIYACEKCLSELYGAIGEAIVPKSVETAKRKSKKSDGAQKEQKEQKEQNGQNGQSAQKEQKSEKGDKAE